VEPAHRLRPLTMRAAPVLAVLLPTTALHAQQQAPLEPIAAILEAFTTHQVVAIAEEHGNEQGHAFRLSLIRHPRFAAIVDDIVVESGNTRYQDVIDRFVRGEEVPYATLRQVWQNTTQASPIWDRPIYEELFRAVRAVNAARTDARRLRVLLGDPPIDWDSVTRPEDLRARWNRSWHPAEIVKREVLARKRRALVIYGGGHLWRQNAAGATLVERLDTASPGAVFTIMTAAANFEIVQPDKSKWMVPSLALTRGTGLENQVDALLYLGPESSKTWSRLSPSLCADAAYRKMRLHRMSLAQGAGRAAEALNKECGGVK
jgi:hypothetical protein